MAALPGGWLVILVSGDGAMKDGMTALAAHGPAVACFVEEHVMYAEARGYRDGGEAWRVVHDSQAGMYHLAVTGEAPEALARLRAAAVAEQDREGGEAAQVDVHFDVPANLAQEICGFTLNEDWPEGLAFTELRRARGAGSERPGLFQRLFRRG